MTATIERGGTAGVADASHGISFRSRGQRLPVVFIALLIAVVSALGFGLWARSIAAREPVVVLSRPVVAGARLSADDLAVAELSASASVRGVHADDLNDLVGRVLTASLPEGALLHPDHVADAPDLPPGMSIVGVEVRPGDGPIVRLEAGLRVMVVWTPSAANADEAPRVLVPDAFIDSVSSADTDKGGRAGAHYVSMRVPLLVAPEIAAGAATDQIRLVLVSDQ